MFAIQQDRKPVARETTDTVRIAVPNITGIPDQMKEQFEDASGMSFDDVRIHYNSAEPIQQKRGKVPVNRWLNGLPSNIVQRKMDVGVALVPVEAVDKTLSAEEVMVDTVMLSGRADTGLKNGAGNKTQGDHIIADALVKEYQKVMCRGQVLPNVFNFYTNLVNEMRYENAIAHGQIQKLPKTQCNKQQESRISTSNSKAEKMDEVITREKSQKKNIPNWREHIEEIISLYNDAYANSYFATHGVGTGGRGEASAMRYLRETMSESESIQPYFVDTLIDRESLKNALMHIFAPNDGAQKKILEQMVTNRFYMMLGQMVNYKNRIRERIPAISFMSAEEESERHQELVTSPNNVPEELDIAIMRSSPEEIIEHLAMNTIEEFRQGKPGLKGIPLEQVAMGALIERLGTKVQSSIDARRNGPKKRVYPKTGKSRGTKLKSAAGHDRLDEPRRRQNIGIMYAKSKRRAVP